jgi:hypothetical protein
MVAPVLRNGQKSCQFFWLHGIILSQPQVGELYATVLSHRGRVCRLNMRHRDFKVQV